MYQIIYVFATLVSALLMALQFAVLGRAVISWFPDGEDSTAGKFLITVTEPVLTPVRAALEKTNAFKNSPIDMSLFAAVILLMLLQMMLPEIRVQ